MSKGIKGFKEKWSSIRVGQRSVDLKYHLRSNEYQPPVGGHMRMAMM